MPAYVIVDLEITDPVGYAAYSKLTGPTLAAYDGRFLVRGGPSTTLEGDWSPQRLVVLEFPTIERAHEWYHSPEYTAIIDMRKTTARSRFLIVEGVPA
ncbi:MAG: DUF1330 domain-containing protein [Herpetosiphon sp.]